MPPTTTSTETETPRAPGETVFEGGFRRVSPAPEPLALTRLRELLLDVATGGSAPLRDALEGFRSWRALATLCGTEWTAGARRGLRGSLAARRVLQRRLRALAVAPVPLEAAAQLPSGSAVHVRGTIRPALPLAIAESEGDLKSHIWSHGAMDTDNVRLAVERGHDFFLTDELDASRRQTARVIVARGHLINADALVAGDRVSVFGFTDRVPGRGAGRADPLDRAAQELAVRAGDELPLLIRLLPQQGSGLRSKL